MPSVREEKVNTELKRELSVLIREIKDPRVPMMISVMKTEVTKDMKFAKIYVSVMGNDEEKKNATAKLSQIIQNLTSETDIENMVKAKGFRDCVASITEDKISVAVRPVNGELNKADVAKIRDIVLSKTTISSQNIVVVEVK